MIARTSVLATRVRTGFRRAAVWLGRRRTARVAAAVSAALVIGTGVAAVVVLAPQVDCSILEASSYSEGAGLARACRAEVEVVSERTPWQTWWATPDGGGRLDATAFPSRVKQGDSWVDLDTSFVHQASSVITLASAPFRMFFSNGLKGAAGMSASSETPLGQIESELGETLKVWFPLPLPNPEISADKLIYDLGDGVRLFVSVNIDGSGFLPVVELADPAAAASFESRLEAARGDDGSGSGMDIVYRTEVSGGLEAQLDDDNVVAFVDAEGQRQFEAAPPTMWDSSGVAVTSDSVGVTEVGLTDRTVSPAGGDRIAAVGVELVGDDMVLNPDTDMLADPVTVWPVYIDPALATQTPAEWVAVRSGGYTNTLYKWGDISSSSLGQGTGYCSSLPSCNVVFKQRLAWEFSGLSTISNMTGTDITKATFKVYGAHSANCTLQFTYLRRTSNISSGSTWSNMTINSTNLGSRQEYHSVSCGNTGYREFTATAGAKYIADQNQTWLDMALVVSESSITYWKRFRANATLSITFNRAPTVTDPRIVTPDVPGCTTGAGRPVIATVQPTLSAVTADPDGGTVQAEFQIANAATTGTPLLSSTLTTALTTGSRASYLVPPSTLVDGQTYAWRVRAYDGARYSDAWSNWCEFTVDTSRPEGPTITPVLTEVAAVYLQDKERGGIGQLGQFTIDRGTQTDVTSFKYSFVSAIPTTPATPDGTGKAVISFTPATAGPVTLTVISYDAAGNSSLASTYSFVVATPTEDAIWMLDEGEGTTSVDSSDGGKTLSIIGAGWGDGPHADFDSREGDHALVFDGVDDAALTDGPIVNTLHSFAVAAFLKPAGGSMTGSQSFVAVSQYGTSQSGFEIGVVPCADNSHGCWQFTMPDTIDGTTSTAVQSPENVTENQWTHVVAEYDATAQSMSLWTCKIGTPANPAPGEPLPSVNAARTVAPWAASGALVLGRGLSPTDGYRFWPGSIDNVRVFTGEVVSEAKIRRLCQGAEATDFGAGDAALDPTTTAGQ